MKIIDVYGRTYAGMLKKVKDAAFVYGKYDDLLIKMEDEDNGGGYSAKLYYGSEEITNMEFNNVIQAQANN